MKTTIIDVESWDRREIYKLFSQSDFPFYSVTTSVDVTDVKKFAKQQGISFYHVMIWAVTRAVNNVPAMLMRIVEGKLVLLEKCNPSFTFLPKDSQNFMFGYAPWQDDVVTFCNQARESTQNQTTLFGGIQDSADMLYLSCLPWFDVTAVTNEHNLDKDDAVPRIVWGKYYPQGERTYLHLCVEVNHRTVDGFHIAQFVQQFEKSVQLLSTMCKKE